MKKIFYLYSKSLLSKLALVAILVIGGGNSVWAQKELPYSYGFENNDLAGEGWTTEVHTNTGISGSTQTYPARTDSYLFKFYGPYGGQTQYLISPELSNSSTGIEVSFYYNLFVTSSATRTFNVGYSTTNNDKDSFIWEGTDFSVTQSDKNWHNFITSFPTGTKYVAIRYAGNNVNFFIDDFTVEISETYKRPKNLEVSSYTESSATLSWTNGRNEEAWQIAYSIKEDFTPNTEGTKVAVTENPYTLSGLTEGVTYYAYVRSNYSGNFSEWSNKIEITPYMDVTINDGNSTCLNAPIYGYKANYDFKSQIIIPKTSLEDITGRKITQFTFYASQSSVNWGDARYDIYLNEVENTTYANPPVFESWGTKVCSNAELSISGNKMVVVFDTPYEYNGGNLMIGFESTATGTSGISSWYGLSGTNNAAYYSYSSSYSTSRTGFLPKMTIRALTSSLPVTLGTNGYTTFASPRALDLANLPSGLKAYKAAVDAQNNKVLFTEINQAVPANTGMLLEGTAETTYNIPVAESGTTPVDNAFLVNSTGGTFTADEGYTYYGMKKATSASDPIVFATFAPATVAIPTNKAYLKVVNDPSGASRQLVCAFSDNTTTAIAEIANRQNGQNSYFNLAGQRVDGSRFTVNGSGLKPGLYIINGKKMVIK